jgi:hypothetical protein
MKKISIYFSLLFLFGNNVLSQELIIKGRIRCINTTESSTKGAENIIVVPAFQPSLSTITASQPSGYFEINTKVPLSKLQDKLVSIYVVSRCTDCREIAKRVFISEDQDRQNRNDKKQYVTIKDWMLNTNCQVAELKPLAADSVLNLVVKQPGQNLENVSAATALTGTPVFLNFLTTITPVLGVLPNAGTFQLQSLDPGKISYGQFLLSSPMSHSANTGFNFSPSRDMSEAAFWNPSAISFSKKPNNLSLLTNVKNNFKLGGFLKVSETISLSAGGIYTVQDERRKSVFVRAPVNDPNDLLDVDSLKMKLKEYAAFFSPVFKVTDQFSLGVTLKSVWQDFNIPYQVSIEDTGNGAIGTFTDSIVKNQYFDVDISATYKLTNALQLGVNLMNLTGTELYADAFVPGQSQAYYSEMPMQNLRSFGLGLTYKWQRLNVGTDVLFTEDGLYDAALGVNFVPFNNALLSGGFAVKQMSYSLAFRIKNFRIAYINDNDWMVNERRTGKSAILNGKIHGGFIFDLN